MITRLVDTMVSAPRCTRAEATDVANAVLDGVDALLLGAETLRGAYPAETVATVRSIARQAELAFDHGAHFETLMAAQTRDELEMGGGAAVTAPMKKVSSFGSLPANVGAGDQAKCEITQFVPGGPSSPGIVTAVIQRGSGA